MLHTMYYRSEWPNKILFWTWRYPLDVRVTKNLVSATPESNFAWGSCALKSTEMAWALGAARHPGVIQKSQRSPWVWKSTTCLTSQYIKLDVRLNDMHKTIQMNRRASNGSGTRKRTSTQNAQNFTWTLHSKIVFHAILTRSVQK